MSVDWNEYDKFDSVQDLYLPARGEGETKATQIVTAVTKLVYKYYNDGDIFDGTQALTHGCNDLSSYANWLAKNCPNASEHLDRIYTANSFDDYEDLLMGLAEMVYDEEFLAEMNKIPKVGSIYECDGEFEYGEDEEEYEYDDDDEYDGEYDDDEDRDDYER